MAIVNLGAIRFNWKGAYNNSTAYVADDVVSSGGNSYICILASTGNAVANTTYWSIMSSAGTDGTDGTDVGTTITTQGDVLYRDGSGLQRLAKGTAAQVLTMNGGATAPSWADAGGGAWEYVEKVIPTTANTVSILQGNIAVGYDYLITWNDIRHSADTSLTCRLQSGSPPVNIGSDYKGTSHYTYDGSGHNYAQQAGDELHMTRVNVGTGAGSADQWFGEMLLWEPATASTSCGEFKGGQRNSSTIYSGIGHFCQLNATVITGVWIGGYGAFAAEGQIISYRRKRS